MKLKLQYFGHRIWRVDSLEKTLMLGGIWGRRRKGRQRMRWLDGITDSMDMSLGVGDGQGGLVCCSSWGRKESDTIEWLNWTELKWLKHNELFELWKLSAFYARLKNVWAHGWCVFCSLLWSHTGCSDTQCWLSIILVWMDGWAFPQFLEKKILFLPRLMLLFHTQIPQTVIYLLKMMSCFSGFESSYIRCHYRIYFWWEQDLFYEICFLVYWRNWSKQGDRGRCTLGGQTETTKW